MTRRLSLADLRVLALADELLEVTFYGDDEQQATELASAWAVRRGWTVEGSA